ncbi:MAG: MFS transporter, partial [bacterium]|nr:MFS transporter [bacterium]
WLLALVALVNRAGSMVLPFITLYLTAERGFTTKEAGQLVGLYGLGSALGAYLGGRLSDRVGPVRALQTSLAVGGVGFIVLGFVRERVTMGVTILAVSLIVEAFRPAVMSAFAERSPSSVRFKAFALLRLAGNLGFGIGPAVGGMLAVYSYRWLFVGDAVTCWAAAALLAVLPVRKEPTATLDKQ